MHPVTANAAFIIWKNTQMGISLIIMISDDQWIFGVRLALDCRRQGHMAARSMVFRTDCPSWIEESGNDTIRLVDYDTYTKAIFLNDVRFTYQSIVRLHMKRLDGDTSQPGDYDLACTMDSATSGARKSTLSE